MERLRRPSTLGGCTFAFNYLMNLVMYSEVRCKIMAYQFTAVHDHSRGKVYELQVDGKDVSVLLTHHVLRRRAQWRLTDDLVVRAMLFPEEVLIGHHGRFIAHLRRGEHLVRVIYEYEVKLPVAVTVYSPSVKRYFQGGGTYEDRILS